MIRRLNKYYHLESTIMYQGEFENDSLVFGKIVYDGAHVIIGETASIQIDVKNTDIKNKVKNPKLTAWFFE